jgi:hypothetical protein
MISSRPAIVGLGANHMLPRLHRAHVLPYPTGDTKTLDSVLITKKFIQTLAA